MSLAYKILSIVYIILCVTLVVMILMQKDKASGLSSGVAGMGGDSYWDKNKGRSLEGTLERYSKILGAVFMVLSLVVCLV